MAPSGTKFEDSTGDLEFPQFPGEDFLAHAATLYLEQAEARLAGRGLLAVAQGHPPANVQRIVDESLDDLPLLDATHKDYVSEVE